MTDPTANDNHRKAVDRWNDEGGRPPSPERSPRPNPVESLPSLPPRSQFMRRSTLPSNPQAASAILLEHTTERAVAKDVRPGHTHS
jgi:hypothetical protein